uniref:NTR domain-containing protein n=1 Tax=Heterorhabditis bacteriophora TaxID=37862 RepID=A0A1I7XNC8_HETBA
MQAKIYTITITILWSVEADKRMIMLTEDTPFIPRAISYFAHLFPFRDDGTTLAFGRDEQEYEKINDKNDRLNLTKKKIEIRDHLIWRDHPMHSLRDMDADIDAATVFHMANPALRKTEYNERMDISKSEAILTLRLEQASYSKDTQVPYLAWVLKTTNEVMNHHGTALVQFVGRSTGSHTEISLQHIMRDNHGRLQIHPPNYLIKELKMGTEAHKTSANRIKELTGGLTITCGQHVDNEVRGIGFIYNVDYLTNGKNNEKLVLYYDKFEHINTSMVGLPYVDQSTNLKLDIAWDDWSCCSACCCSGAICGFYTTYKDWSEHHKMRSYRVRRGYLSIFISNLDLPLNIKHMVTAGDELNELLRLSPYKEKGIAVFSSLLVNTKRFRIGFFDNELKIILTKYFNSRGIELDKYEGLGMYVDIKSCANDTEKTNCTLLAKCRRMEVTQMVAGKEDKLPEDPCSDVELITLITYKKRMSFRIAGADMDSNIDKVTFFYQQLFFSIISTCNILIQVTWKISQTTIKSYNAAKNCSDQGKAVHENKLDLLILNISCVDTGHHIEAFLSNGSSFVIELFDNKYVLILTSCLINKTFFSRDFF